MARASTSSLLALVTVAPIALTFALAACSKSTPEPSPEPAATSTATTHGSAAPPHASASPNDKAPEPKGAAAEPKGAGPEDIGYDAPAAWNSVPNTNAMRKATFKIPKVAGDADDAELAVSSAGGGVDANIKRWAGQFGGAEPKTEARTVNGLKVTVVEIKGTFASGGMMGAPSAPKDKQMLLGAIVDGGDRLHFFKMTGPEKTVTSAKKDFDKFVASFRAK